ncbi:MAG: hypothetical protein M1835_001719, partial [Candelina submexicana]
MSSRHSVSGLGSSSVTGLAKPAPPSSPFAPTINSISENSWVHQKVLLVYGQIGDPAQQPLDGNLTVDHHQDSFPPTHWPVTDNNFKALVHLVPGQNRLRFDFYSPKVLTNSCSTPAHSTHMRINYLPLNSSPPLQLVILLGSDSPGTFDAVPERVEREGNGVDTAVRKYRMAAYLWQAFTAEQMYRNNFSRRCFRFQEEWQTGSLSNRDRHYSQMRSEAKVHILRTNRTAQEIRDLSTTRENGNSSGKDDLGDLAVDTIRNHFRPMPGQKLYVSVLYLDAHCTRDTNTMKEVMAFAGGAEGLQLAIFGSQALQSYPSSIEEVVPAFSDCTRTDTNYVANAGNESGSNWEAANVGLGGHLHEIGHLFGCTHQVSGVMSQDYVRLNRTFMSRESYSTRTKSPGLRLGQSEDECTWERLDCLRFRYHPCFRLPSDIPSNSSDDSVQAWPIDNGNVIVTAATGVAFTEIFTEADELCRSHIEYHDVNGNGSRGPPGQITLTESDIRSRLPEGKRNKRLRLIVHCTGQGTQVIEDFPASKISTVKLPKGRIGFRGSRIGAAQTKASRLEEVVLESSYQQTKLLVQIKVYHGFAVCGIEFLYEDHTSQLFGKKGDGSEESEFNLDTRRGEILIGFNLRAGLWIDGIELITSGGRRSGIFGNPIGGS